jgi:hypothetical protein
MKNIFLVQTDKPSRLVKIKDTFFLTSTDDIPGGTFYNIYITSDEFEPEKWYFNTKYNHVSKSVRVPNIDMLEAGCKKIILTTDPDLIKDGVQAIDDEFLKWWIKNPSCEYVVVYFNYKKFRWSGLNKSQCYEIIIPQEELEEMLMSNCVIFTAQEKLKQEPNFYEKLKEYFENTPREKVLEDWNKSALLDKVRPTVDEFIENSNEERLKEAAERFYSEQSESYENAIEPTFDNSRYLVAGFIDGVKSDIAKEYWFEKFEEDLKTAYFSGIKTTGEGWNGEYANGNNPSIEKEFQKEFQEWLKQFKKKKYAKRNSNNTFIRN